MYRAKEAGRARSQVFDVDMHTTATTRLRMESDLCRAVERREFVLHYQPIMELAGEHVVGFEALVRWQHPERGLIGPNDFIPLAEETGLIGTIGDWVLDTACHQLAEWGSPLVMSVNMSTQQFAQPELVSTVTRIVQSSGIAPGNLMLEITESTLMPRAGVAEQALARLTELGITIGLDDFGTGYSCLSYLHEFPVTTLKIDRSFVQRIGTPTERREIVHAIISLAHNLDIDVTAEGVETAEQLDMLRALDCEHAQGFYFAKPLDAATARSFLAKHRA
jgi:EAL domain-containing protein (putative c-di-GMP-specific phosphodiesterase class I)